MQTNEKKNPLDALSAVPNADSATDEEILEFGVKFLRGYVVKLAMDFDRTKTAAEMAAMLKGEKLTAIIQLKLELQQRTLKTLHRFTEIIERKGDGNSNQASEARETED